MLFRSNNCYFDQPVAIQCQIETFERIETFNTLKHLNVTIES